jgi:lipopolysaccharide export system ATP-binding protein
VASELTAKGLVKEYKKRKVVNEVSLNLKQGEIVGLLGPNGAGKTTTFYMICGIVRPNEGIIELDKEDITTLPMYRRARMGIGYLPQEASVFRRMSVEDNIMSILQFRDMTKEERLNRREELIKEFKLEKVRTSKGYVLSGGERRRTEIARCLASEPKFILLDEPFAGIDPIASEEIMKIVHILREEGIGILITDHNVHETLSIVDRAYILIDGKIFRSGKAKELSEDELVRKYYLGENFSLERYLQRSEQNSE